MSCRAAERGSGLRRPASGGRADFATVADLPPDVADAAEPTVDHDWGFVSDGTGLGREMALPRAKLTGGCSATNGTFWMRGWAADYDGWAAAGNPGWGYDDLAPIMRAVEADQDFADPWHGTEGPVPVCRIPSQELAPIQRAFIAAATRMGHAPVDDHNRPGAVGVGPIPRNVRAGVRMSMALTHLLPARARPNLTVLADSLVDRVELVGRQVRGVRLADGSVVEALRVVLAAGAYASPAILMRSGVGEATWLNRRRNRNARRVERGRRKPERSSAGGSRPAHCPGRRHRAAPCWR